MKMVVKQNRFFFDAVFANKAFLMLDYFNMVHCLNMGSVVRREFLVQALLL